MPTHGDRPVPSLFRDRSESVESACESVERASRRQGGKSCSVSHLTKSKKRFAWLFDQGGPCMREAPMAKLHASEVAQQVTWEAMRRSCQRRYENAMASSGIANASWRGARAESS